MVVEFLLAVGESEHYKTQIQICACARAELSERALCLFLCFDLPLADQHSVPMAPTVSFSSRWRGFGNQKRGESYM